MLAVETVYMSAAHLLGMLQVVAVALGEPPVDRHLDPDYLVHNAANMPFQLDKVPICFIVLNKCAHLHNTQLRPAEQCDSRVAPSLKQVQRELVLGVNNPYEEQTRGLQRGHRQCLYVCICQLAVAKRHTCRRGTTSVKQNSTDSVSRVSSEHAQKRDVNSDKRWGIC